MKKVLFFIISFIFILTFFNIKLINKISVSANNNDIVFNNFEFSTEKQGKMAKSK